MKTADVLILARDAEEYLPLLMELAESGCSLTAASSLADAKKVVRLIRKNAGSSSKIASKRDITTVQIGIRTRPRNAKQVSSAIFVKIEGPVNVGSSTLVGHAA